MKLRTSREWAKESPYERFFEFTGMEADRFGILFSLLEKLMLNAAVIPVNGNQHFFIFPRGKNVKPSSGGAFPFRGQSPVMLVAHYDRVPGSPGANDNSAAVFQMIKTALRLDEQGVDYWIIVLTDKEELKSGEGIREQGSFSLAENLKIWGLGDARIFNFDACGTGDTFIFSSTAGYLLKKNENSGTGRIQQNLEALRNHALATARYLRINKVLSIPTPFSDDAGFLRAGLPAQTITMLPTEEAAPLASLLRNRREFADAIISGPSKSSSSRMQLPETWRCLNGPSDSYLRLTPEYYSRVVRFAVELCRG
ncbi:MAG: M28 family peptidase [Treponema sp.]|jgi:hypothetical protein|nr:M28 family peptidase [Treponema sp.]